MKKVKIYGRVENELGVILVFSQVYKDLGFSNLKSISSRGFDIDSINYNGYQVTVEFEYLSKNFINHQHYLNMEDGKKYIVVCWVDDCGLVSKLKEEFNKELFKVIELNKYVELIYESNSKDNSEVPKYIILAYNPVKSKRDFEEWYKTNCFRINTNIAGGLPEGSKVLLYHDGYIRGGFSVVRFEIIDTPQTEKEWELYHKLTNYPVTLYSENIENIKKNYTKYHIFYDEFFLSPIRVKLSDHLNKKMNANGLLKISKEEYYDIIGR